MKVLNFIKDFFSRNTGWKIASIIIAVFMWFVVMNTLNPAETKTFSVSISLLNEQSLAENGFALLNTSDIMDRRIEVKVKSTRPALDELSRQKDTALKANLDFKQINPENIVDTPQNIAMNISPAISDIYLYSYEIVSFSPSFVNVVFDSSKSGEYELETNFTGKLEEGYSAAVDGLGTEKVTVYGPATEFENVEKVVAEINLDKKTDDFSTEIHPVVYSKKGQPMPNFIVDPPNINAQVSVKYTKNIEVTKPATTGIINSERVLKNIDWSPKVIELTGDKDVLDSISPIILPSIELDKLVGSDIRTYEVTDFIKDERVALKSNAPRVITVTIEVSGKDGKNITLSADEIKVTGLKDGLKAQFPSQVVFTVFGEPEALAKATNESFSPSVDLTDIEEGATEVPLNISLPEGVEVRGETKIYVYVTKGTQPTTQAETETVTEPTTAAAVTTTEEVIVEETVAAETSEEKTTEKEDDNDVEINGDEEKDED
ncbi:MAG: hypothetical protein IJR45_08955 [Firmicutes bacterium]|nr:hypothetical protein [Bacillota bacterium]